MKKILFLTGAITLFASTGCVVSEGRWHGHAHGHFESRPAVIIQPEPVVVRPPVIVVRPPEIIVR